MSLDRNGALFRAMDVASRCLGWVFFGEYKRLSTHLGNLLKDGTARPWHLISAALVDTITLEFGHCYKNAGKL